MRVRDAILESARRIACLTLKVFASFIIGFTIACGPFRELPNNSATPDRFDNSSSPTSQETTSEIRTISGVAVHVSDGDTLIVEDETGFKTIIRLAGIDAPESDQEYGDASRETLATLVRGKILRVESNKIDRYGRTVGKITANGKDICLEMIRRGFAWHFKRYEDEQSDTDRKLYSTAEIIAHRQGIGLWRDKNPKEPWIYRDEQRQLEAQQNSNTGY